MDPPPIDLQQIWTLLLSKEYKGFYIFFCPFFRNQYSHTRDWLSEAGQVWCGNSKEASVRSSVHLLDSIVCKMRISMSQVSILQQKASLQQMAYF